MHDIDVERRRFSRINFDAEATVAQAGTAYPVQVLDISVKGVLAHVQAPAEIDEGPAALQIRLADGLQISMQIRLIHRQDRDLGFRCEGIDLESAAHLRRLVELNLGSADAAERVLEEMLAPIDSTSNPDSKA